MRRPLIVVVLISFLIYPTLAAPFSPVGGIQVISLPTWDQLGPEWTSSPAEGPLAYSGTGAARDVDISGVYTSGGSTTLDASSPGYVGLNLPTGWTADHLTTSIDELSVWVDDVVINQKLDSYHNERWLFTGPDSANNGIDFRVPDGWTIVKSDPSTGSQHPTQGNFELSGSTGAGYGNTMGWEFEANYGATTPLEPTNEVCLSQLISAPWREIYSVEISFLYFVRSLSSMDNNVHLFARFGGYEGKIAAFRVGTYVDTWIEAKVTVPNYYLQTLSLPDSVLLDIGLGTDIDGQPGLGGSHAAYIDDIEVRLKVRPFPEEIGLRANGVFVEGGVSGSVSPYVPVGANRDCLSNYSTGIDLNGRFDNGILEVGAAVPDFPDWSTAYAYQVGLQFRLNVPQGAAITSAYFTVEAESGAQYLPSMRIFVADEDNVGAFTSGLPELQDQFNWVDTNIVWTPSQWSANGRYGSPDISALLQEVVSRPGWQSDNYVLFMLDYAYSTQDFAWNNVKGSSNYPQADLARLFVNYLAPHPEDIVHSLENSKTLTIDHSNVASDLTDFPLLIDIWDSDLRTDVQPDGDDIGFMIGRESLDHEIELFDQTGNGTHAHLIAWVRVPFLSSTENTKIVMLYDNDKVGNQEAMESVWDSRYAGVWHLSEDPTGTMFDSTAFGHDGTGMPGGSEPTLTTGKIDGCTEFYGTTLHRVEMPHSDSLSLPTDVTLEAWVRTTNTDGSSDTIVAKWDQVGERNYWLGKLDAATLSFFVDDTQTVSTLYSLINDGNWHHVVGVADAAAGELRIIVDGTVRNTASYTGSTQTGPSVLHIGNNPGSVGLDQEWDGRVDEVRVSKSVRSADWMATSFMNQDDPEAFYSVGWESGVAWWDSDWNYRRETTVIAGASAIPSGYSVNVTFDHASLVGAGKSMANGDDVRIIYWDGSVWNELDRVLDLDTSWNDAFTTVWFKTQAAVPASMTDDNYYLYYGNPSASSPPADRTSVFLYYDGFESGDLSGWDGSNTASGDTLFVVNTPIIPVYSGTLAVTAEVDNVADAQAMFWWNLADTNSLFARIHIYLNPGFSTSDHVTVMQYGTAGWSNQLSVTIDDDMTMYMWNAIAGEAYGFGIGSTISIDSWHTLELQAVISDTDGEARLWFDGDLEIEATGINLGTTGIGRFCTGYYWSTPKTEPNTVIVDDCFLRMWVSPDASTALGSERTQTQDFQYKKDITVDHNRVFQTMTNFPVLIDIYDTDLRTDVQNDGDDIVFVSGGVNLNHEIELFNQTHNSTHAHLVAWVKANLSSSVDTVISMYYGNPAAESSENPGGVWSDNYVAVHHMEESPVGTLYDSTDNQEDLITEGGMNAGDSVDGQIGQGIDFDDSDDGAVSTSTITINNFAISAWIKHYGTDSWDTVVNIGNAYTDMYYFGLYNNVFVIDDYTNTYQFGTALSSDTWYHLYVTWDGSTVTGYVDGSYENDYSESWGGMTHRFTIGAFPWDDNYQLTDSWDGVLDEIRISSVPRSGGWIATEYANQNSPSTFYSVGSEEIIGGGQGGGSGFRYTKDITIDHTKINSDLNDFPVMIELFDTDLRSDVQSDGDDIVFKNGTNVLNHEIELFDQTFNSTHSHLVAWVKADLSSSADTTITMYYGDPAAENQENPSGVWNDNYVAVWHMNQDPSSSNILDSTMNGYDLSPIGFGSDQRIYDGRLGTAISVDGTDDRFSVSGIAGPVNDFTFQSWFVLDSIFPPGSDMHFFRGNSPTNGYPLMRFAASSGKVVTHMEVTSDLDETCASSTSLWYADSWYQFAFVRNMSAIRAYHYVNGSLDYEDTSGDNANPHLVWDNLYVLSDSVGGNMWGPGAVSEFRISSVSLPADWIAAEYENQNDPASFYAVGAEEDLEGPSSFAYRKDIVIDHNKVDADLSGFPVLIDIYDADLRTDVQADGDDIIFKKGGATLAHEIELFDQSYSPTHAHLVAWVLVDLSASADTVITMYYGNPSAENQEDAAAVWGNSYLGVWHLSESSGDAVDSTSYGTSGTPQGGLTQGVTGQVDDAYDFLGSNGRVNYGDPADGHLDFGASDDFTISCWVYLDSTGNPEFLVAKRPGTTPLDKGYVLGVAGSQLTFQVADGAQGYSVYASTDVTIPAWHYVTVIWDDDSTAGTTIFMDGADDKASTSGTLSSIDSIETTVELTFGAHVAGIFASDGRMDEVRIASVARPSGWISTEYNNQFDPASFYSVSDEETVQAVQESDEFKYAKDITVDARNVVSDLLNFPLLIELYDTDLHSDAQADGDDIAFMIDDEILDHEIELFDQSFNSTHSHLLAWVRVPFLSSTVDTQITMLYGNSAMDNQENPYGVWGSRYAGVWHLAESSGNAMDSTLYEAQGTPSGAIQGVSGAIGGAYEFNGAGNVNLGDPADGHLDFETSSFTYSLWVRFDATTGTWQLPIHKGGSSAPQPGYEIETTADGQDFASCLSDGTQVETSTWTAVDYGEWMYLVAVVDRVSDYFVLFKNALETGTGADLSSFGSVSTSQNLYISSASYPIDGVIDEVRISRYAHTPEWIYTEYLNQLDPGGFISVDQERLNVDTQADTHGVAFTTNSDSDVQMSVTLRVNVSSSATSYTDDLSPGTSFIVTNGSLPTWTTKVQVSPPSGISEVSFSVHYPTGEWTPTSITNPLGVEKYSPEDWQVGSGVVTIGHDAVDAYGIWTLEFQDRNHVMDLEMGLVAGQLYDSGTFNVGDDIRFRTWTSGSTGSTVSIDLIAPNGTAWYSGVGSFAGQGFPLPYQHKKELVIDHTKVDGDLWAFPMLVDIFDVDLHDDVRADGADIAFAVGDQVLDFEVEVFDRAFNSTHAHLTAWVQVPFLSSSVDTTVSMYYGNPAAPSVQNPNGVWDSNYVGVWHLGEIGTGLADEYVDSSVYNNHGQGGDGNVSYLPTRVSGPIGYGQDFSNHFIDCGNDTSLDVTGNQITLQLWMQYPTTHPWMGPFNHKGYYDGYRLIMSTNGQQMNFQLPGNDNALITSQSIAPNEWHHVVATYDGSLMRIYVDGAQDAATTVKTDDILSALPYPFRIGHGDHPEGKAWTYPWLGQIDEVRVSDTARSGAWIQTEFENQKNPQDFITVGNEESAVYCDSESISLDNTAPEGEWLVVTSYSDGGAFPSDRVGLFTRSFTVRHNATLTLQAPSDAVGDHITATMIGNELYFEVMLEDQVSSRLVTEATVTLNWTESGFPTIETLNELGSGRYGLILNSSDLGSAGRWRIEFRSYHQYYGNATEYLYLDLSHESYLTYVTPEPTEYGNDLNVRITLRDSFDNSLLAGASISSNGTLVGPPTDFGNGTYLVTLDSAGYGAGQHAFSIQATPADSYKMSTSIDVIFTIRPLETEAYPVGSDPAELPWGQELTVILEWHDIDNGNVGIPGGSISGGASPQLTDLGDGVYSILLDTRSYSLGTHVIGLTMSKTNYQSATTSVTVNIVPHKTAIAAVHNETTPVGAQTHVLLTFLDIDVGSSSISSGNLSLVTADWGTGSSTHGAYGFWIDTSGWAVGIHLVNLTLEATSSPRYYEDAVMSIQVVIRRLNVFVTWEYMDPFPYGSDFEMYLHVNISEPGTASDGNPINNLPSNYFSAENATGTPYTIMDLTFLGDGEYRLTIDNSAFSEGDYTIVVFADFQVTDDYADSQTAVANFNYRGTLTALTSPDYPQVTTTYGTNVSVTLHYVDLDRSENITTAAITAEGASISWLHTGDGYYDVLIIVTGWDQGSHYVNLTADDAGYEGRTLTFEVLVQIAYTYATPTVTSLDLPLGDTGVFYVDYWDIIHDTAIEGATVSHDWIHSVGVTWTGSQYRLDFPSLDTDALGSYTVLFNFSKGPNYQFGYFNLSVNLRTHYTEFRLASAVEPTSYAAVVNVSVYYGDLDNDAGIASSQINCYVTDETGPVSILSFTNDTMLGDGYYLVRISAPTFGGTGLHNFTVYLNWTGPGPKYYNGVAQASVNIIGEESKITILDSPGPTPYLGNMSYTYFYSELYSGNGITNQSHGGGNVHVYVVFVGESIAPSQVTITEPGTPGQYKVEFNNTIFGRPGVYTMIVYINWSVGVSPFYPDQMHSIQVRVLSRNTVLSVTPPSTTPYGTNATFTFSYDDATDVVLAPIAYGAQMQLGFSLPDYSISYDAPSRDFTVSFDTSILGASLGAKSFTVSVTWIGAPYYSNVTDRLVLVTVSYRDVALDHPTPDPTSYADDATFIVTFTDITGGASDPIDGASITLFSGASGIPLTYYSVTPLGSGQYQIDFNTTYFTAPGSHSLGVSLAPIQLYYDSMNSTRTLIVMARITTLTAEPVGVLPYNSSISLVLYYRDLLTLANIGNLTQPTTIKLLNGSSWLFTSQWRGATEDYLLVIETHNQGLQVNTPYILHLNMSYPDVSPYYRWSDVYVSFQLRYRASTLEITDSPFPTPYLYLVNFTVYYQDLDSASAIPGATIEVYNGGTELVEDSDFYLADLGDGKYGLSVESTSLDGLGTTTLSINALWTGGAPYHQDAGLSVGLSVTQRLASVEITKPPEHTPFLENVTFSFRYYDTMTSQSIGLAVDEISIFSELTELQPNEYTLAEDSGVYSVSINSTLLGAVLVQNWNLTVFVDWNGSLAPYFTDDQVTVLVTTTSRMGTVTFGMAPTVPIGDNMTLTFRYADASLGRGIGNAIIAFDCVEAPGLIENTDYWIVEEIGLDIGNYTILVDTSSLGTPDLYNFYLQLLWSSSAQPYYQNTSVMLLSGSSRRVQALLRNDMPDPMTVPLYYNVSVNLTLSDIDHELPIQNAESVFSVEYMSTGLPPSTWNIWFLSEGVYQLVVNCSDAGAIGTNALIIGIDLYPYQPLEIQIPFQIRLRDAELTPLETPDGITGETTYAIVQLVDKDAGDISLAGASLTVAWADVSSYVDLGDGSYNITLSAASLDAGTHTLVIGAALTDYFIANISVSINLVPIDAELVLPAYTPSVYWGDSITIHVYYNDTLHSAPISGAHVEYQIGVLTDVLSEGAAGNYSFTLDTGRLAHATTYIVTITAARDNFESVSAQFVVDVEKLPVEMTLEAGLESQSLFRGQSVNVTVYVSDTYNLVPLTGAVIRAQWMGQPGEYSIEAMPGSPGYYSGVVDTSWAVPGSYRLDIRVVKDNYLEDDSIIEVTIRQIPTKVWLDAQTSTYDTHAFNWSEEVHIGVYVLVPTLNITHPFTTGLSDCTVEWTASGSGVWEELENGTAVGGPGYFYCNFSTAEYRATPYTILIRAIPGDSAFSESNNYTALTVVPLETSIESPYMDPVFWGWTGTVTFQYWDLVRNIGVDTATVQLNWDGAVSYSYVGNGTYSVFLNTSLVDQNDHQVVVIFGKENFQSATGFFKLKVKEVPTETVVYAPELNQVEGDSSELVVPYGDTLYIKALYNDTHYGEGIPGATTMVAYTMHGEFIEDKDSLPMSDLLDGNYSIAFDTSRWTVSDEAYTVVIDLRLENRKSSRVEITVTIINLPTLLVIEPPTTVRLSYSQTCTVWVYYSDAWEGHEGAGIAGGFVNATSLSPAYVIAIANETGTRGAGWYRVDIASMRATGSAIVNIVVSKPNCDSASASLIVEIEPSDMDLLIENAVVFGIPISIVVLIGAFLWRRIFALPKLLRKLNGMVRALRRGKIPAIPEEVMSRQQIVADLFNDTCAELDIVRMPSDMPPHSVVLEVPEIEELIVQLSILTELTPEQEQDFRDDVSKMRLSEQVNFVKEVITQEAIKRGRTEGKTMEQVWDETKAQALAIIRGEELPEETPEPEAKTIPEPEPTPEEVPEEAPEKPLDELLGKLADHEIEILMEKLRKAGLPEHEVQNIVEQARQLPRDLVDELVKTILGPRGDEE